MSSSVFELALLLSLKDAASGGLDRFEDRLRASGKEGRALLRTVQDLRKDLKQGLVLAGAGVGMVAMLKGGIDKAADFESAVTELRLSIEELGKDGTLNMSQLNDQMNRFEHLGVKLGNRLPGTTSDFVNMFVALKQGGLQTETILNGAGEAVANLAVLAHSVPADLAKDFAQIGEQFQLKPSEFAASAETFLKNYRAVGLRPEQMIEGSKFAQLRGGLPLGLKGLSGLETMSTLLSTLKVMGLEGGIGGREVAGMLMGLSANTKEQKKADAELRKKGIKLDFFDKRGEFLGAENIIQQVSKLKKLSAQERLDVVKRRFGGAEALGPVTAFAEQGAEGYEKLKQRAANVVPVQQELNQLMDTYNAKLEAALGTIDNLKVTTFTPMLSTLKPALDTTNSLVGSLQEFAGQHQGIAKVSTELFGTTGVAITLAGTLKSGAAAWTLWRIAAASANDKSKELGGSLAFLSRFSALKLTVGIAAIGAGVEIVQWLIEENKKRNEEKEKRREALGTGYEENFKGGVMWSRRSEAQKNRENLDVLATQAFDVIQMMPSFQRGIQPENTQGGKFSIYEAASQIKQSGAGTALSDPNVLTRLFRKLDSNKAGLSVEQGQRFKEILALAFPQESKVASQNAMEEMTREMDELSKASTQTTKNFNDMLAPTNQLPATFSRAERAASSFADRVGNAPLVFPSNFGGMFTPPSLTTPTPMLPSVKPSQPQFNFKLPSSDQPRSAAPSNFRFQGSAGHQGDRPHVSVNYSPRIEVKGGDPNEFAALLYKHGEELEDIISRRIDRRNARGAQG